jgi:two-component system KDP operon response regulator KdpE
MNTVLVVGERPEHALALAESLGFMGIEAIPSARDWKLAVRGLTSHNVGLVLLDIEPGAESRTFFETLKELTDVPIVARASEPNGDEAVWYLDHGAADYLARKLTPAVLVAKLQSLFKTIDSAAPVDVLEFGDITIDLDGRSVRKAGADVMLTPLEFRLLAVLAESAGRPVRRRNLLERVWGEDFRECAHYLRLYVGYLRQKLEDDPRRPTLILTEWGHGYRLNTAAPVAAPRRAFRTA